MKKLSLMAVMLLMLPTLSFAQAHNYKGQIMDSACAKAGNHDAGYKMTGTHTPKDCTMACVKAGSSLVLYDPTTQTTYKLSNPMKVKHYAGEDVDVKGTLNQSTQTIRVESIKKAS